MRRASSRVSLPPVDGRALLLLVKVEIPQRLSVGVADDEALVELLYRTMAAGSGGLLSRREVTRFGLEPLSDVTGAPLGSAGHSVGKQ